MIQQMIEMLDPGAPHVVFEPNGALADGPLAHNRDRYRSTFAVLRGVLSDKDAVPFGSGDVDPNHPRAWMWGTVNGGGRSRGTVRGFGLDTVAALLGGAPTVLVADCEGGLIPALREFPQLLDSVKCLYYERDPPGDYEPMEELLRARGFANVLKASLHASGANEYGIEFLSFVIQDYDSKLTIFEVSRDRPLPIDFSMHDAMDPDSLRKINYELSEDFLRLPNISTTLVFSVGQEPLSDFRMIERHYFRDQLIKSYGGAAASETARRAPAAARAEARRRARARAGAPPGAHAPAPARFLRTNGASAPPPDAPEARSLSVVASSVMALGVLPGEELKRMLDNFCASLPPDEFKALLLSIGANLAPRVHKNLVLLLAPDAVSRLLDRTALAGYGDLGRNASRAARALPRRVAKTLVNRWLRDADAVELKRVVTSGLAKLGPGRLASSRPPVVLPATVAACRAALALALGRDRRRAALLRAIAGLSDGDARALLNDLSLSWAGAGRGDRDRQLADVVDIALSDPSEPRNGERALARRLPTDVKNDLARTSRGSRDRDLEARVMRAAVKALSTPRDVSVPFANIPIVSRPRVGERKPDGDFLVPATGPGPTVETADAVKTVAETAVSDAVDTLPPALVAKQLRTLVARLPADFVRGGPGSERAPRDAEDESRRVPLEAVLLDVVNELNPELLIALSLDTLAALPPEAYESLSRLLVVGIWDRLVLQQLPPAVSEGLKEVVDTVSDTANASLLVSYVEAGAGGVVGGAAAKGRSTSCSAARLARRRRHDAGAAAGVAGAAAFKGLALTSIFYAGKLFLFSDSQPESLDQAWATVAEEAFLSSFLLVAVTLGVAAYDRRDKGDDASRFREAGDRSRAALAALLLGPDSDPFADRDLEKALKKAARDPPRRGAAALPSFLANLFSTFKKAPNATADAAAEGAAEGGEPAGGADDADDGDDADTLADSPAGVAARRPGVAAP
ncbi:hypothetical protein JL721_2683 [Aureococcus anophagefferens]|nr:hypothetical protein JL721_2683 [Aureococcus anophagefferens]